MRYHEIVTHYRKTQELLNELEIEYKDKKKGDLYLKRKMQLIGKLDHYKKQAKELGTNGTICHVRGKRSRGSIRNPRVLIQESFNLYFVGITEDEASALTKLHVKNIVHYTIKFIRPGVIMTSS